MSAQLTQAIVLMALPMQVMAAADAAPASMGAVSDPLSLGSLVQVLLSLIAVLLMFAVMVFVLRRVSGMRTGQGRNLRIIDGISVGTRERILLIECGQEQVLVGVSAGRMQTLKVLEQPVQETAPVTPPAQSGFAELFRQVRQRT